MSPTRYLSVSAVKTLAGQYFIGRAIPSFRSADVTDRDRPSARRRVERDLVMAFRASGTHPQTYKALTALRRSARAMAFAVDEASYLNEVCKIVVDECEQSLAWIGFAQQTESKVIVPVAHAGFEEGYLETLRLTWSDAPAAEDQQERRYELAD